MCGRSKTLVLGLAFVYVIGFVIEQRLNLSLAALVVVALRGGLHALNSSRQADQLPPVAAEETGLRSQDGGGVHLAASPSERFGWDAVNSALWRERRRFWWFYAGLLPCVALATMVGLSVHSAVVGLVVVEIWSMVGHFLGVRELRRVSVGRRGWG